MQAMFMTDRPSEKTEILHDLVQQRSDYTTKILKFQIACIHRNFHIYGCFRVFSFGCVVFFRKMCGGESDNEQKKAGNKRKHWRKPTKIYQIRKRK